MKKWILNFQLYASKINTRDTDLSANFKRKDIIVKYIFYALVKNRMFFLTVKKMYDTIMLEFTFLSKNYEFFQKP